MAIHGIEDVERDGLSALDLTSPDGLVATYLPTAGMVCGSLRHGGAELLGQRKGLANYAKTGSTMGIPLLHPWANRLARTGYAVGGVEVEVPADSPLVHPDPNGLPIHGLCGGCPDWRVTERDAGADRARLVAELDFSADPARAALFPFPHRLRMEVELRGRTLDIATELHPTGDARVPIAFGYHPYFQLPDVPRRDWHVELPVKRRAALDDRCLPTGESEAVSIEPGPLGDRVFDDLYPELEADPVFVLAGGGRRLEVAFGEGYGVGVVYAPEQDDVICFEPMTAPTNPFEGGAPLGWAEPGQVFRATYEIRIA